MSSKDRRISEHTEKMAGKFLFDIKDLDSDGLDMRTRIKSESTMRALLFYGILANEFECDTADTVKCLLERLLVSEDGLGRMEGVTVLQQNFPKKVRVRMGYDPDDIPDET